MKAIEIERGIPLPKSRGRSPLRSPKYPLRSLAVGDSFCVAGGWNVWNSVRTMTYRYGARHSCTFETRKTTEPEGIRVWRTG